MKKLLVALLCALSMSFVGACGDDDTGGDTDPGDDSSTGGEAMTYTYLISTITIPGPDADPMPGFDLDMTSEMTCGQADFNDGIDNQLARLSVTLDGLVGDGGLNGQLAAAILDGSALIVIEVSEVNDLVNDDSVTITIKRGTLPEGTMPEASGNALAPGQTITNDPTFTPISASGSIANGQLIAGPVNNFSLEFDIMGNNLALTLNQLNVRGTITAGAMTNAALGGAINVDQLVAAAGPILPAGVTPDTVATLLGGMADLNPNADAMCADISAGFSFAAVDATLQ